MGYYFKFNVQLECEPHRDEEARLPARVISVWLRLRSDSSSFAGGLLPTTNVLHTDFGGQFSNTQLGAQIFINRSCKTRQCTYNWLTIVDLPESSRILSKLLYYTTDKTSVYQMNVWKVFTGSYGITGGSGIIVKLAKKNSVLWRIERVYTNSQFDGCRLFS